jgi:hypothetical protein
MPKFNKKVEDLETRFEKWMYVLKNLPRLQALPPQLQEKIFEKIFRVAEIARMTKAEATEYENSLKNYRDWYSSIETAKREKASEIALNLLKMGMSVEIASDATGLSIQQIEEIIKTMNSEQ